MADFPSDHMTARPGRDAWMHDNARGLALAAEGDWGEATEAFAAAADSLARILPSETRAVHEPLALVLSNHAQALFRVGRLDDAMQQAQRACALRVAIAGEDGMPVARARMDLAVMLASAGRVDEGTALVQRAISGIEHRVGEEDARLAIVLENAARIALAGGRPANAEPLLLRLHALLDAHELSTARAEQLLGRVANARASQAQQMPATPAVSIAAITPAPAAAVIEEAAQELASPAYDEDALARVYAHATVAVNEEWEDQPLRDAVAVTDVLLRTTPSGVPVIPAPPEVQPPVERESAISALDALSLDLADEPTMNIASSTDFDLDLAFDDPVSAPPDLAPPAATPAATPAAAPVAPAAPSSANLLLGFDVEHGVVSDDEPVLTGPPISTPVPDALEAPPVEPPVPTVAPVTKIVSAGPTTGIVPIADIVQTAPYQAPVSGAPVVSPSAPATRATAPGSQRPVRRTAEERVVLPPGAAPKGKGGMIAAIVGALVVAGGAAAFFLTR